MKTLKRDTRFSLPMLKTAADEIKIGDNIVVRRHVFSRDEICIATVIEVKTVQSNGAAQSLRNLNVDLQKSREKETRDEQDNNIETPQNETATEKTPNEGEKMEGIEESAAPHVTGFFMVLY